MLLLDIVLARLTIADTVEAMRPYKPKTGAQLREKTDPAHRMMRQAYKRRTSSDKTKDSRYDKVYYRRNKAQLKQRGKRSRQLHKSGAENYWCYEYVWDDGLTYSMVIYSDRFAADCTAQRLNLKYKGMLSAIIPWSNDQAANPELPLAHEQTYETSKNKITASVYAGHKDIATSRDLSR
jgi:uncharacterized protein (DUF2147 family)